MTKIDHYRVAEQILRQLARLSAIEDIGTPAMASMAQAHAILAAIDHRHATDLLPSQAKAPHEVATATAADTAELERLRGQVAAAYRYADQLHDYTSPHGVAARYAAELRAVLDGPTAAGAGDPQ